MKIYHQYLFFKIKHNMNKHFSKNPFFFFTNCDQDSVMYTVEAKPIQ